MEQITKQYLVSGKVQGVYYRASVKRQARILGVNGYTRNLPDGRVEVIACGHPPILMRLADWLWQGPPMARVENVVEHEVATEEEFKDFTIRS